MSTAELFLKLYNLVRVSPTPKRARVFQSWENEPQVYAGKGILVDKMAKPVFEVSELAFVLGSVRSILTRVLAIHQGSSLTQGHYG